MTFLRIDFYEEEGITISGEMIFSPFFSSRRNRFQNEIGNMFRI